MESGLKVLTKKIIFQADIANKTPYTYKGFEELKSNYFTVSVKWCTRLHMKWDWDRYDSSFFKKKKNKIEKI